MMPLGEGPPATDFHGLEWSHQTNSSKSVRPTANRSVVNNNQKNAPVGWRRWSICVLLFLAATINYIDRQVIGILKPILMDDLGWNEIDYSNVVFAFQAAYAIGYCGGGWFMDRVGLKLGYGGVGYYPRSGFVHLDIGRPRIWVG